MCENIEISNLHEELKKAFHRFKKVNLATKMEWSEGEFFAIHVIAKYTEEHPNEKGIYVSEMANILHIAPSAVSRMLKNLEQKGLIERSIDKKDRRNTNVYLTNEGKEKLKEIKKKLEKFFSNVIEEMGETQVLQLITLFNKMTDIMESQIKKCKE